MTNLETKDYKKLRTGLHLACSLENYDIARLLLEYNADTEALDKVIDFSDSAKNLFLEWYETSRLCYTEEPFRPCPGMVL